MDVTVETLEAPLDAGTTDELVALHRAIAAVEEPDDPPIGPVELTGDLLVARPRELRRAWLLRSGGDAVGTTLATVEVEGDNAGFAEVEIDVRPELVGGPVEIAALRAALPWLGESGARTVAWWTDDDQSHVVAESLGLTFRQLERCSRLRIADVDDEQQEGWLAAPRAEAEGYRMRTWTGPCPDELIDAYAAAYSAMVDAPLDDVDYTPSPVTPELVRRMEASLQDRGGLAFAALALDAEGSGAGMTLIHVHPERPQLGHQEDTAVVAHHRGRAIGRWLKATNLRRARQAVPELQVLETYNAESNPWMLAINVDMGFRPHRAYRAYQAEIDTVTDALDLSTTT